MEVIAALFFFLILFIAGLIKPSLFAKLRINSRKKSSFIFGALTILTLVIVGVIASGTPFNKPTAACFNKVLAATPRHSTDQPDDTSDYQVHVIYALPSDGVDRDLDTNGKIATSVTAWENWLCQRTGGKTMAIDTYQGMVDISFVRFAQNEAYVARGFSLIGQQLHENGFDSSKKIFAIYYDGSMAAAAGSCGGGEQHNAVIWLRGSPTCANEKFTEDYTTPNFRDFGMLHEILHNLGFVPDCAKHVTALSSANVGHVDDDSGDILYYAVGGSTTSLDKNHDDYFDANIPNCRDLKNSAFLVGGGKELPLLW